MSIRESLGQWAIRVALSVVSQLRVVSWYTMRRATITVVLFPAYAAGYAVGKLHQMIVWTYTAVAAGYASGRGNTNEHPG